MAVNQSVVNFLTSRGISPQVGERLPLYDFRKKLFEASGLSPDKGAEFRGTENENLALLSKLSAAEKAGGVSITPDNIFTVLKGSQATPTVPGTPEAPSDPMLGADASSLYQMPSDKDIASQAFQEVTGGVKFPLEKEAAQAEKAAVELKGQAEKEKLISTLASRGLFFSGKRTTGLEAIDADTVAKTLGVDRKFALLIAGGLESAAQRVAKEAQAGNKDALVSLRSLGYDVNPLTGRIEQSLSAKNAAATQSRFETTNARLERNAAEKDSELFTKTQINTGAANAGVPITEFKGYDSDTQNYFINNGEKVAKAMTEIDKAKAAGEDRQTVYNELQASLKSSNAPKQARERVLKYFASVFPTGTLSGGPVWYNPLTWGK